MQEPQIDGDARIVTTTDMTVYKAWRDPDSCSGTPAFTQYFKHGVCNKLTPAARLLWHGSSSATEIWEGVQVSAAARCRARARAPPVAHC